MTDHDWGPKYEEPHVCEHVAEQIFVTFYGPFPSPWMFEHWWNDHGSNLFSEWCHERKCDLLDQEDWEDE